MCEGARENRWVRLGETAVLVLVASEAARRGGTGGEGRSGRVCARDVGGGDPAVLLLLLGPLPAAMATATATELLGCALALGGVVIFDERSSASPAGCRLGVDTAGCSLWVDCYGGGEGSAGSGNTYVAPSEDWIRSGGGGQCPPLFWGGFQAVWAIYLLSGDRTRSEWNCRPGRSGLSLDRPVRARTSG